MKNKKSIYILLPAVLVIWILIVIRVINYQNPDNETFYIKTTASFQDSVVKKLPTDYKLMVNYADPFLKQISPLTFGTSHLQDNNIISTSRQNLKEQKDSSEPVIQKNKNQLPDIQFFGTIINLNNDTQTALCAINKESRLFSLNTSIDSINLITIWRDSILVTYKDNNFVITKTNAESAN